MRSNRKLYGAAVLSSNEKARGIMDLLIYHVRNRLNLVYYLQPDDIDIYAPHDFVMVFSLKSLREVVKFYASKRQPMPLVVHVNSPEELQSVRHQHLFPGIRILPIPQALFGAGDPDVTVDLSLLDRIAASL